MTLETVKEAVEADAARIKARALEIVNSTEVKTSSFFSQHKAVIVTVVVIISLLIVLKAAGVL